MIEGRILNDSVVELHDLAERLHRDPLVDPVEHVELVAAQEVGREAVHPVRKDGQLRGEGGHAHMTSALSLDLGGGLAEFRPKEVV